MNEDCVCIDCKPMVWAGQVTWRLCAACYKGLQQLLAKQRKIKK